MILFQLGLYDIIVHNYNNLFILPPYLRTFSALGVLMFYQKGAKGTF